MGYTRGSCSEVAGFNIHIMGEALEHWCLMLCLCLGNTVIVRSCESGTPGTSFGCYQVAVSGQTATACYCSYDRCNGVSGSSGTGSSCTGSNGSNDSGSSGSSGGGSAVGSGIRRCYMIAHTTPVASKLTKLTVRIPMEPLPRAQAITVQWQVFQLVVNIVIIAFASFLFCVFERCHDQATANLMNKYVLNCCCYLYKMYEKPKCNVCIYI
jgi:hypothetical protein